MTLSRNEVDQVQAGGGGEEQKFSLGPSVLNSLSDVPVEMLNK